MKNQISNNQINNPNYFYTVILPVLLKVSMKQKTLVVGRVAP